MPTNERMTRLEGSARANSEAIAAIIGDLNGLRSRFDVLSDRTVTWKQLITGVIIPLAVCGIGCIIAAAAIFNGSYSTRLTKDIEYGISSSPSLKKNFDAIDAHLVKVDGSLSEISRALNSLATPTALSAALKDATTIHKRLAQTLPRIRNLLTLARDMKVPIPPKTYNTLSKRLFGDYLLSTQPLRGEVWNTLIDCANTRTFTDGELHPLSESDVERAKSTGNYFEGEVDLSSKTEWKNSIFKGCKVSISHPERGLNLINVRFIDCDFKSHVENIVSARLLETILQNTSPELNIPHFKVLRPYYNPKDSQSEVRGD